MSLEEMVSSKSKLTRDNVDYILNKTDNQADYLLLNYMEQRIIESHGKDFVKKNTNKIQYIMGIILQGSSDELYKFYSGCFEQYMQACGRNVKAVPGFNIMFTVLIHMSIKILRKQKSQR